MANDSLDFVQRGKVSIVRRQYADAVKICRLGLLAHPTLLEGRLVLGMALTALGRWDEVLAEMRVALELDPESALAWLLKGEALVGKGDFEQAESTLRKAKQLDPTNQKPDQLLAEIQVARAAGFEGVPAEPTDTKVYPARKKAAPQRANQFDVERTAPGGGEEEPTGTGGDEDEPTSEHEEATEVDPHPSGAILLGAAPIARMPEPRGRKPPRPVDPIEDAGDETGPTPTGPTPARGAASPRAVARVASQPSFDDDELNTGNFKRTGGDESSYEPPPSDDYAERARPAARALAAVRAAAKEEVELTGADLVPIGDRTAKRLLAEQEAVAPEDLDDDDVPPFDPRAEGVTSPETPARVKGKTNPPVLDTSPARVARAAAGAQFTTSPTPSPREIAATADLKRKRGAAAAGSPMPSASVDGGEWLNDESDALTFPAAKNPLPPRKTHPPEAQPPRKTQPPDAQPARTTRPPEAPPRPTQPPEPARTAPPIEDDPSPPQSYTFPPMPAVRPAPARGPARSSARRVDLDDGFAVPENAAFPQAATAVPRSKLDAIRRFFVGDRPVSWAILGALFVIVVAGGIVSGLFIREWRLRARVAARHAQARERLASGTWRGLHTAEELYRTILAERDEPQARALRARTLAQLSFEFGDPTEPAARAVANLGTNTLADAEEARAWLSLISGRVDEAAARAEAVHRAHPDAASAYLLARVELGRDRPEAAAGLLQTALAETPEDLLALHAQGLTALARRDRAAAEQAWKRVLLRNPGHVPTLLDRALSQIRSDGPSERTEARQALESVLGKLAAEASPAERARAWLGQAELELARVQGPHADLEVSEAAGQVEAARQALAKALTLRPDGALDLATELAAASLRALDLEGAEKEARRVLALAGTAAGPKLVLARAALLRDRPADVPPLVDAGARAELAALKVLALVQLGQRDQARTLAEALVATSPDAPAPRLALARVELADGRPERAQRELERIERVAQQNGLPRRADVALALADVYGTRSPDRARLQLAEALHRDPLSPDVRLALARLDRAAGRLADAKNTLEQLLKMAPSLPAPRRELAQVALESGDPATARTTFDALAAEAKDVAAWLGAARASLALHDAAGADERLSKAMALGPTGPLAEDAQVLRARALFAAHRVDEAVSILDALGASATRGETAGLTMLAWLELGQPDRAAAVPFSIPPRLRNAPEVLTARARLEIERGRDVPAEALAIGVLNRIDKEPGLRGTASWVKVEALTVLGRAQWDQGQFKPALRSLRAAVELDPRNARAFHTLGLVLEEVAKKDEAVQALETATTLDPKFAEAQYDLGRLRTAVGDTRAAEAYQAYLTLAPNGPYASEAKRALAGQAPAPKQKKAVKRTSDRPRKSRRGR